MEVALLSKLLCINIILRAYFRQLTLYNNVRRSMFNRSKNVPEVILLRTHGLAQCSHPPLLLPW